MSELNIDRFYFSCHYFLHRSLPVIYTAFTLYSYLKPLKDDSKYMRGHEHITCKDMKLTHPMSLVPARVSGTNPSVQMLGDNIFMVCTFSHHFGAFEINFLKKEKSWLTRSLSPPNDFQPAQLEKLRWLELVPKFTTMIPSLSPELVLQSIGGA